MFYDAYKRVCEDLGIAETKVLTDVGISKGARAGWMNGTEPSNRTKKQLADYFGITIEELLEGKIKKPEAQGSGLKSEDEIRILDIYRKLPAEQKTLAEQLLITLHNNK